MRYVDNLPFIAVTGQPFEIENLETGMPKHEASFGEVLLVTLRTYRPQQGQVLDLLGIRSYNRCLNILEAAPQHGTNYGFEDTDFKVLHQVCGWMLPLVPWFRNAPAIEDLLLKAPEEVPKLLALVVADNGVASKMPEKVGLSRRP